MIGIPENYSRIEFRRLEFFETNSLHRAGCPDGHEHRRLDRATTGVQRSGPRLTFSCLERNHQRRTHFRSPLFRDLCLSTILIGVAKKSNSSRKRFSKCRKNEKCSPAFPPEVKTTNVGGRTPIWVRY